MKKVYLCLLAGASLALASCSSDDLTAVGGGSDTTGGGSTSTVTPVSTPSVPLDNWKKARVVLNSPANTLVSLSYSTAEEGETPIIDNYVVSEGTNNIDFTVPTYVDEVKVTYTSNGSEASTTAVLSNVTFEKEFVYDKNDGWYTTSNDPSTLGKETMRNEVVVKQACLSQKYLIQTIDQTASQFIGELAPDAPNVNNIDSFTFSIYSPSSCFILLYFLFWFISS